MERLRSGKGQTLAAHQWLEMEGLRRHRQSAFAYDVKGNLLTTTTPSPDGTTAGSVTSFLYDAVGQLTRVTDPRGNQTNLTYTTAALIATVTDADNQVTSFEYDARGNRTALDLPPFSAHCQV